MKYNSRQYSQYAAAALQALIERSVDIPNEIPNYSKEAMKSFREKINGIARVAHAFAQVMIQKQPSAHNFLKSLPENEIAEEKK